MIRGLGSNDGEGFCTAVPFAVETLFEVPFMAEDAAPLLKVSDEEMPLIEDIEEPGSFL